MAESHEPVLEMLWEAQDPHDALEGRFGFSDGGSAGRWVAAMLDELWGVRIDARERIVMSAGNALAWVGTSSGRLLAKWSVLPERFPRLARTAGWLDILLLWQDLVMVPRGDDPTGWGPSALNQLTRP